MNDKYDASDTEIRQTILDMRQVDPESMIEIWNEISSKWSVSSVSQIHNSLYISGHIQQMVVHILETKGKKSCEAAL